MEGDAGVIRWPFRWVIRNLGWKEAAGAERFSVFSIRSILCFLIQCPLPKDTETLSPHFVPGLP